MKCPSCATSFSAPVARCPECKLSLQRLDMKFGMVPRHSRFLTDRTSRLPLNDVQQLRGELRIFEKKFPQVLFSVFIDVLPADASVSDFAFWMANRARFSSVEKKHGENFDLLLVIDLTSNSAALIAGYGLEPSVPEEDLQAALDQLTAPLRAGKVADGVRALLEVLIRNLRLRSQEARGPKKRNSRVPVDAW